ncbi:MAG: 2-oxoglutarate oxidoreductase [Clostridiales bacterium]|nr:2-oxoglutarate oxidoreductase [Clostridiales bacterium]
MESVYTRPSTIIPGSSTGFCPGCMHGTTCKLVAEVIEELGIADQAACVWGIGCCGLGSMYTTFDSIFSPHGRACAMASAYKRANPDEFVFTYQGDGDLASIGIAETLYAANRGENISVVFVNNGTYGMTGGQMAPTTLVGQKATTAPFGRKPEEHGYPVHICELLDSLKAPHYLERVTCVDAPNVIKTKAAIKKAFRYQLEGKPFSLVEVVSNCPTNWGLTPLETLDYLREHSLKEFALGVYRDRG